TNALLESYNDEGAPFFLWASFFDPHPPYLAPDPWHAMYDPDSIELVLGKPGEHDKNPPHFQLTQTPKPDFSPWKQEPYGPRAQPEAGGAKRPARAAPPPASRGEAAASCRDLLGQDKPDRQVRGGHPRPTGSAWTRGRYDRGFYVR